MDDAWTDDSQGTDDSHGTVAWLDAEELRDWLPINAMFLTVPARLDSDLRRTHQVSLFSYLLLARLSEASSRTLGLSDLAGITHGSLSKLSHALTVLENRGWVQRRPSPLGGRATDAVLTNEGYAMVLRCAPTHVDSVRRVMLDHISSQQRSQLGDIARATLRAADLPVPTSPPEASS